MNDKQLQLIRKLMESSGWTTATTLAKFLGVSDRTVKNYISELNNSYPEIIISSPNGYKIQADTASRVLQSSLKDTTAIPQTNKDRTTFVITRLLRTSEPLSMFDLCDELYISMSTLRLVLKRVRTQLSEYQLELNTSGDEIKISGEESNRRKLLRSVIINETSTSFFDLDILQEIFDNIDLDFIVQSVNETLWAANYYVSDYSSYNIILHIVIAIDRCIQNPSGPRSENVSFPDFLPKDVRSMALNLADHMEDYYGICMECEDILEIALLFYTRATPVLYQEINENNIEKYLGKAIVSLVTKMEDFLQEYYGIGLTNSESRVSFALHIRSLISRLQTGNISHNPLKDSIRQTCPLIYDIAVGLSSIITEYTGMVVSDDEIAYIAFHIGNTIETQKAYESRIHTILNCPTYYSMNQDLNDRLSQRFSNDMIIMDVTSSESQLDLYPDADLILTTVPLKKLPAIPTIQIQPFLTMADTNMVDTTIRGIKEEKAREEFLSELRRILLPEFFEHLNKPMTRQETIHYMCNRLYEAGFSRKEFESAVLEREQLSSTAFSDFAIPHEISMRENRSCMYILINDQPIKWEDTSVKLVILLCFSASDKQTFYKVFEPLSLSLLRQSTVQKIVRSSSFEEFIDIISEDL